jgi:hypothetical protein
MSTVLPHKSKEERELNREIATINGKGRDSYFELTEDASELYLLSQKELTCTQPKQSPKWCKPAVVKFIHLSPNKKWTKDNRVRQLVKMLDIGSANTLDICKVSFLSLIKKIRISFLRRYQISVPASSLCFTRESPC